MGQDHISNEVFYIDDTSLTTVYQMPLQNPKPHKICLSSLQSVLSKILCLVNIPSASSPQTQMLMVLKELHCGSAAEAPRGHVEGPLQMNSTLSSSTMSSSALSHAWSTRCDDILSGTPRKPDPSPLVGTPPDFIYLVIAGGWQSALRLSVTWCLDCTSHATFSLYLILSGGQ